MSAKRRKERPKRGEKAPYHRKGRNNTAIFFIIVVALLVLSLLPRTLSG
ncbi:MAG: hypothetical protein ACXAE3_09110 [Candidatus Kariarchaeaceae archaeon]